MMQAEAPGLGYKPGQQDVPPAGDDGSDPAASGEEADGNVTPEEQEQYDLFVGQALNMLSSSPKILASVQKLLAAGSDRITALATAAVTVVDAVRTSGAKNGVQFSVDVLLHGGQEIIE